MFCAITGPGVFLWGSLKVLSCSMGWIEKTLSLEPFPLLSPSVAFAISTLERFGYWLHLLPWSAMIIFQFLGEDERSTSLLPITLTKSDSLSDLEGTRYREKLCSEFDSSFMAHRKQATI